MENVSFPAPWADSAKTVARRIRDKLNNDVRSPEGFSRYERNELIAQRVNDAMHETDEPRDTPA